MLLGLFWGICALRHKYCFLLAGEAARASARGGAKRATSQLSLHSRTKPVASAGTKAGHMSMLGPSSPSLGEQVAGPGAGEVSTPLQPTWHVWSTFGCLILCHALRVQW